jgi:hypothetical protein
MLTSSSAFNNTQPAVSIKNRIFMKKYLLCRPQGGLNDMLCQIEKCCRYAEKTGRLVIVDTNYKHSENFNAEFGLFFKSRQSKLLISSSDLSIDLEQIDVYPESLKGKINSYQTAVKVPFEPFKELSSNEPITFDFTKNYKQSLVVHHQGGGGNVSIYALLRLKVTEAIKEALIKRLTHINGSFTAIHVRHTDYLSDYESTLKLLISNPPARLFVATDNQNVLNEIVDKLPNTKVFSFSTNLSKDGKPIHNQKTSNEKLNYSRNMDAILDLLTLGLASNLIICKISTGIDVNRKPTYSGFSLLAKQLWENKIILNHLLKPTKIRFGLD